MDHFSIILALLGVLVVSLAIGSKSLGGSVLPPTLLALLFGISVGPAGFGWVDLADLGDETLLRERLTRLTIAIALMGWRSGSRGAFPANGGGRWRS